MDGQDAQDGWIPVRGDPVPSMVSLWNHAHPSSFLRRQEPTAATTRPRGPTQPILWTPWSAITSGPSSRSGLLGLLGQGRVLQGSRPASRDQETKGRIENKVCALEPRSPNPLPEGERANRLRLRTIDPVYGCCRQDGHATSVRGHGLTTKGADVTDPGNRDGQDAQRWGWLRGPCLRQEWPRASYGPRKGMKMGTDADSLWRASWVRTTFPERCFGSAQHDNRGGGRAFLPAQERRGAIFTRMPRGLVRPRKGMKMGMARTLSGERLGYARSPRDVSAPLNMTTGVGARFLPPRALKRRNDGAGGRNDGALFSQERQGRAGTTVRGVSR